MNIILVDDSFSARRALQSLLESRGCHVRSFADIQPALDAYSEEGAEAVFCDYVLQELDGVEMWRRLQALPGAGSVPFVLISGLVDERLRERCTQEGIQWVLGKPFTVDAVSDLLDEVRQVRAASVEKAATASAPQDVEMATQLVEDLAGFRDLAEVAILSGTGDAVAGTYPSPSAEVKDWFERSVHQMPLDADPGQSLIHESGGRVWMALDLHGGMRFVGRLRRFSAVGPVRFFARRLTARRAESVAAPASSVTAPSVSAPSTGGTVDFSFGQS